MRSGGGWTPGGDPLFRGTRRQLLEQTRTNPSPLILIGDGEGDLGYVALAQTHVTTQSDNALAVIGRDRTNQRPTLRPVRLEIFRGEPSVDRRMAVKPEIEAQVGELGEEADESVGVVPCRRAQTQGASVAQNHVDVSVRFDGEPPLPVHGVYRRNRHR